MMDGMERTGAAPMVWPTVRARNARALVAFLVDVLGFEEVVLYGEGDRVDHAELAWPQGGGIMLGSERPDGAGRVAAPGTLSVYVGCADPDALYERASASGAHIEEAPHDTDYGSRDVAVRDPEGNHWTFGTYLGGRHAAGADAAGA
jgi:uncharacterized glyoxalase superfamily protein PhnB